MPLEVLHTAMTPHCDEDGTPKRFGPYKPHPRPCDLCPGRCCRLQVEVSLPDAVELCGTLGLTFFSVMTFMPTDGRRAIPLSGDPRFVAQGDEWMGLGEIVLRRQKDGACHFLVNHGGYWRCSSYATRPSGCRLYPLAWTDGEQMGGPMAIICPLPYPVTPSIADKFQSDFERAQERWAAHDAILDEWRALPPETDRSAEAFLVFAAPRAAARFNLELGPMLAPGSADQRLLDSMFAAGVLRR